MPTLSDLAERTFRPRAAALEATRRQLLNVVTREADAGGAPGEPYKKVSLRDRQAAGAAYRAAAAAVPTAPNADALADAVARRLHLSSEQTAGRDLLHQALRLPSDTAAGRPTGAPPVRAASSPLGAVLATTKALQLFSPRGLARLASVSHELRELVAVHVDLAMLRHIEALSSYSLNGTASLEIPHLEEGPFHGRSPGGRWVRRKDAASPEQAVGLVWPGARGAVQPLPPGECAAWSPTERFVACRTPHGRIVVADLEAAGSQILALEGDRAEFSPDGRRVGVGHWDKPRCGTFTVADLGSPGAAPTQYAFGPRAGGARPAPSLLQVAAIAADRQSIILDTAGARTGLAPSRRTLRLVSDPRDKFYFLSWTPDSAYLVVVLDHQRGALTVDARSGQVAKLCGAAENINCYVSPDGAMLALAYGPRPAMRLKIFWMDGRLLWRSSSYSHISGVRWAADASRVRASYLQGRPPGWTSHRLESPVLGARATP